MFGLIFFMFYFVIALICAGLKEEREQVDQNTLTKKIEVKDGKMENRIEKRIIRNEALDEVSRKLRKMSASGEVIYFTAEDVDEIINEVKRNNN